MKKLFKNNIKFIIGFVFGAIVFGGLVAYAYIISSSDVSYEPEDNTWNATNVKVALDDLYEIANKNASDYSKDWFPEGIPLLPPLDADNYTDYITVESYNSANLHNGNEVWAPFANKNLYSYYGAGGTYQVSINNPVYADKIVCQAGGWTDGYSNYIVYYLDGTGNWNEVYASGNISTYPSVEIPVNDIVYGIKLTGYHYSTAYNKYYPFVITRLQLLRNWS